MLFSFLKVKNRPAKVRVQRFFTFVNNSSTVRTKIGLRKVETKLSVSTTRKFLKNIALSNSTLWKLFKMWSLNLSKVELERAIFFKNFLVVESGKIVSTSLNPTFCPDSHGGDIAVTHAWPRRNARDIASV